MGGGKWAKIIRYYGPVLSSAFSAQVDWHRKLFHKESSEEEKNP